ncbi:MAG: hypothetical protein ACR2M1_03920 [Gemmatimonadaceae bacterium]
MPKDSAAVSGSERTRGSNQRLMWWGAAALILLIGYADLWRGGETIAPILLVLAYCVLIPVAILKR